MSHVLPALILMVLMLNSWSKPPSLVEAINQLDSTWTGVEKLEVVPTGPAYFSLVMLEQLAEAESLDKIRHLTQADLWKKQASPSSNQTGWTQLDNSWWMSSFEKPSKYGLRITSHFRTKFEAVDFHNRQDLESLPIGPFLPAHSVFAFDSILLTKASYTPQIPGGLSPATAQTNTAQSAHELLQTQIIPIQLHESEDGWQAQIDLSNGSGRLTIGTLHGGDGIEAWTQQEAIMFLPLAVAQSAFRPALHGGKDWKNLVGVSSNYDRAIEYGKLPLNDWIIHSQVRLTPHQAPAATYHGKQKPPQPKVLYPDKDLYYIIEGPHGETIFRGRFPLSNIK
jgi:hypothetical protein